MESEVIPESIRPTFAGEATLDAAWTDISEPGLPGIRLFRTSERVAVLVHRGELWDTIIVQGPERVELGVLKSDEVVETLNNLAV